MSGRDERYWPFASAAFTRPRRPPPPREPDRLPAEARAETVLAAWFEISMGRCGILLLCHKLDHTGRCTLAEFFHRSCPDPHIVAILAHEADHYPPQAHARVLFSKDHGHLLTVMRKRLIAA
jgi:hypothetical protein